MRTTDLIRVLALAALGFAAIGASRAAAAERPAPDRPAYGFNRIEGATLAGLQLAYESEMNTRAKYELFATIAWREGHPRTARLFAAIAQAEAIHAANHRANIERLGGIAMWERESVVIRPTVANLEQSIEIEKAEKATVYRVYGDFARLECDYDALASFNYAGSAEGTHARMFADELERLGGNTHRPTLLASLATVALPDPPAPTGPVACICTGCGSAFHAIPGRSCPNCGTSCATMKIVL